MYKYSTDGQIKSLVDSMNVACAKDLYDALSGNHEETKNFLIEKEDNGGISIRNAAGVKWCIVDSRINYLIELLKNKLSSL